jgi:hypothetical protein
MCVQPPGSGVGPLLSSIAARTFRRVFGRVRFCGSRLRIGLVLLLAFVVVLISAHGMSSD